MLLFLVSHQIKKDIKEGDRGDECTVTSSGIHKNSNTTAKYVSLIRDPNQS